MIRTALLLSLPLVGCAISAENFAERSAEENCRVERRCYPDDFDAAYASLGACIEDLLPLKQEAQAWFEAACEPDYAEATACYRAGRRMSCEEIEAGEEPEACEGWMHCF